MSTLLMPRPTRGRSSSISDSTMNTRAEPESVLERSVSRWAGSKRRKQVWQPDRLCAAPTDVDIVQK
jgi:hypothetical protein